MTMLSMFVFVALGVDAVRGTTRRWQARHGGVPRAWTATLVAVGLFLVYATV
jgi:hypothetical protein